MKSVIIRTIIVCAVLGIAWLIAGRRVTLFLDWIHPSREVALPASPVQYDGGGLRIGSMLITFASTDNLRGDIRVACDSNRRVYLAAFGKTFPLGPRTDPGNGPCAPDVDLIPDAGDEVRFTSSRSLLAWPTPFEFRIMGDVAQTFSLQRRDSSRRSSRT